MANNHSENSFSHLAVHLHCCHLGNKCSQSLHRQILLESPCLLYHILEYHNQYVLHQVFVLKKLLHRCIPFFQPNANVDDNPNARTKNNLLALAWLLILAHTQHQNYSVPTIAQNLCPMPNVCHSNYKN